MKDLVVTDLIAAFDVMLHTMLLKKMEDLGMRGWTMQVIAMNQYTFISTVLRNAYRCMCRL